MLKFYVYGTPAPKSYIKTKNGAMFLAPKAKEWQEIVRQKAAEIMAGNANIIDGPVGIEFTFYMPRRRGDHGRHHMKKPDASNLAKSTEDGMTGVVFTDDRLVGKISSEKLYADFPENVGVEITICLLD